MSIIVYKKFTCFQPLRGIDTRGGEAYFSAQLQISLLGYVELSTRRQKYVEGYVGVNFTSILVFV
jgi:hypothetical protein